MRSTKNLRSHDWLALSLSILLATAVPYRTLASSRPIRRRVTASDTTGFIYGFDFSTQEPDPPSQDTDAKSNYPPAVQSALKVLGGFSGTMMDQSIDGFGAQDNPEPSPGAFDTSSIGPRIRMILNAGGIPVITLVQAPSWMYTGCTNPDTNSYDYPVPTFGAAPCPDHYTDFASLAAHIAKCFPDVKYFVVWSEMRGFFNRNTESFDAVNYTQMYNDVYDSIKAVRPDAMVGGPYATMSSYVSPHPDTANGALHGAWGYIDAFAQAALSYWLNHKVGADFVAIDGKTDIASSDSVSLSDPLTASEKYYAVDEWIRARTNLPIWWMESHIQPDSGWNDDQAAAARVATLVLMNGSGASVGMQWQPQEQTGWPDEGLWTSTEIAGGGQPTLLAKLLLKALPILSERAVIQNNEPTGVVVATGPSGAILVNTTNYSVTASLNGQDVLLGPDTVIARMLTAIRPPKKPYPNRFFLSQNYPNPFNPTTNIGYQIADLGLVTLKVYDVLGQRIATLVDKVEQPGNYEVKLNGSGLASGVYFYRLVAGGRSIERKMMLLK